MGKIRGKKLTRDQVKLLEKHYHVKSIDANEWLYCGEEFVAEDGSKHAAKNSSKRKYVKFIHRETAEVVKVAV